MGHLSSVVRARVRGAREERVPGWSAPTSLEAVESLRRPPTFIDPVEPVAPVDSLDHPPPRVEFIDGDVDADPGAKCCEPGPLNRPLELGEYPP